MSNNSHGAAATPVPEVVVPLWAKLIVGGVAGITGTSVVFPIDTIKTKCQNSKVPTSPIKEFSKIVAESGRKGFYKGLVPNLIGVAPEKALKLGVNDYARTYLKNNSPDGKLHLRHEILAGMTAGALQVVATNPMEIVKLRMQVQSKDTPPELRRTARQIVQLLGFRGLYSYMGVTLIRDVPFSAIFFPAYANLSTTFAGEGNTPQFHHILAAGAASGALAAGLVTPADVVKTRLQVEGADLLYSGIVDCARKTYIEGGMKALYKGALARMTVQAPLFGITLTAFELQKRYIRQQMESRR